MDLLLIGIVLLAIFLVVSSSRNSLQRRSREEEDKLQAKDLDGFMERKQAYNQMQKPGEVDNSVEVISKKKK